MKRSLVFLLIFWAVFSLHAIERGVPMPSGAHIADFAGVLEKSEKRSMRKICRRLEKEQDIDVTVVIINMTLDWLDSGDLDDFSKTMYSEWNVKNSAEGRSVLLIVATQERDVRVLYGKKVPARFKRVFRKVKYSILEPSLKKDPPDIALKKAVVALDLMLRRIDVSHKPWLLPIILVVSGFIAVIFFALSFGEFRIGVFRFLYKGFNHILELTVRVINSLYGDEDRNHSRRIMELKIKEEQQRKKGKMKDKNTDN